MEQFRLSMEQNNGNNSVSDVVIAKSLDTIQMAYDKTRGALKERIGDIEDNKQLLQEELDILTDKEREKAVRKDFRDALRSHADRLDIATAEIKGVKIGARPAMASGSSGPRIYLAMHLALLEINAKYGVGPSFPFIVDTPRQQGLDDKNTAKLLSAIYGYTESHQIFVANESVPVSWKGSGNCNIIYFEEKRNLLRESEYRACLDSLSPLVQAMQEGIRIERENAAKENSANEIEYEDINVPIEEDDEDEEY
jgi:hypothetical protein